ncbi:MAG: radical SAM protein, partial [Deltaproteobacteria bacterium]|nr:radical SAM protein [Deltaproteobacteria bacterium]
MSALCVMCGHRCQVDRQKGSLGRCKAERLVGFYSAVLHFGEEPPLSGSRGSGAVFFTRCNLKCVFCQNWQISQNFKESYDIEPSTLTEVFLKLAESGAHNVNLVSPTPYVPQIALALAEAKAKGLNLPIIYNSGGYDSLEALAMMEGLVDIYLPDAKIGLAPEDNLDEPDSRSMRLFGA